MHNNCLRAATTLVELLIAVAIMVLVSAAMVPMFTGIRNSWDSRQGGAEAMQNGRVLMDHLNRNLSKAVRVTSVSNASQTNGYIEFENNDGNNLRYDVGTNNYVRFGPVGSPSDLAGPVSQLKFTCYDACDVGTPITDVNSIRFVKVETILANSAALGQGKTLTTSAYLRTNGSSGGSLGAWWKLDETSGLTAADSSGNGNDGTLTNMTGDEWTTGMVGGALTFGGYNDYVSLPIGSLVGSLTSCTIGAWVNWSGHGEAWQRVFDFGSSTSVNMFLTVNNIYTGTPRFAITTTGWWDEDQATAPHVLSAGWHHIAVTINSDSTTHLLYIDGQVVAQNTSPRYTPSDLGTTTHNWLGRSQYGYDPYLDGSLDDVRIYSYVLGAQEIAQLADPLRYREFTEAKTSSDTASIPISTPSTDTGDLLIAAVATDGDTSSSLAAPVGQGWTLIDRGARSSQVTLGAWWKLAGASEPGSHTFTWTGSQQAYGWMMRFSGHNSTSPINVYAAAGATSSTPSSPAVITTVGSCLILRLGAFDDDDITLDNPGLSGHSSITMDRSAGALLADGFETSFSKWTDGGTTDWDRTTWQEHWGSYAAHCGSDQDDLISDNMNTSGYGSIHIEFWYRDDDIDDYDDVYLQLYNGSVYNNRFELGNTSPEDEWYKCEIVINNSGDDAQYFRTNFRIEFEGTSIDYDENLWIDDVTVSGGRVSGGAGYVAQSAAGSSGTSNFAIGSSNEARMLTIAIAPNSESGGDGGCEIRP